MPTKEQILELLVPEQFAHSAGGTVGRGTDGSSAEKGGVRDSAGESRDTTWREENVKRKNVLSWDQRFSLCQTQVTEPEVHPARCPMLVKTDQKQKCPGLARRGMAIAESGSKEPPWEHTLEQIMTDEFFHGKQDNSRDVEQGGKASGLPNRLCTPHPL